jgi:hypothetical protein
MLLVCVDLATHEFEIEPLKNKSASAILDAFKVMIKRPYIKLPFASIQTDQGSEFKGTFNEFLKKHKIFHNIAMPDRHSQNSMVESLNRSLGRLLNGYMNRIEEETKKQYNEWTDIVDKVRKELNEYRKVDVDESKMYKDKSLVQNFLQFGKPTYKVGDMVYHQLEAPENALGKMQSTKSFREGDYRWSSLKKKVVKILYMSGKIPFRYLLEGLGNVSYTETQLRLAEKAENIKPTADEETVGTEYKVKEIIDIKTEKKVKKYLIWFQGELKQNASWQTAKAFNSKEDLEALVKQYNEKNNKAKTAQRKKEKEKTVAEKPKPNPPTTRETRSGRGVNKPSRYL